MLASASLLNVGRIKAICVKQAGGNGVLATLPLLYPLRGYALLRSAACAGDLSLVCPLTLAPCARKSRWAVGAASEREA